MIKKFNEFANEGLFDIFKKDQFLTDNIDINLFMKKCHMNKEEYIINEDKSVDVIESGRGNGRMNMSDMQLKNIPVKFRKVEGGFDCSENKLTTLKGCPNEIGGLFSFHSNNIYIIDKFPQGADGIMHFGNPVAEIINLFHERKLEKETGFFVNYQLKACEMFKYFGPVRKEGSKHVIDWKRFKDMYYYITGKDASDDNVTALRLKHYKIIN